MARREKEESVRYLSDQIITYLGNKRRLLPIIDHGVRYVRKRLGGRKLRAFDAFSGSGIVSRYLKQHCEHLFSNDLEHYSAILNLCYLSNIDEVQPLGLPSLFRRIRQQIKDEWAPGLFAELYAPADDHNIQYGERVFYTRRNAIFLDTARRIIGQQPPMLQPYLLAPLLYGASVHTNTSGVFKGFYKNSDGIGQFGGQGKNALSRIMTNIEIPLPIFSRFACNYTVSQMDATDAALRLPGLDFAYLDPPYNQHPYGSNYFMLNLLADYQRPTALSPVSGIPHGWNRSAYNIRKQCSNTLHDLLESISAPFILLSYNSEGFLSLDDLYDLIGNHWHIELMQQDYATFRGCRNLYKRPLRVKEYFFLLERK